MTQQDLKDLGGCTSLFIRRKTECPKDHSLPRVTQPSVAVLAAQPGAEHDRMGVGEPADQRSSGDLLIQMDFGGHWTPVETLGTEWAREGLAELLQGPSINNSAGKLLTTSAPTVEARTPPSVPAECKPVARRPLPLGAT